MDQKRKGSNLDETNKEIRDWKVTYMMDLYVTKRGEEMEMWDVLEKLKINREKLESLRPISVYDGDYMIKSNDDIDDDVGFF